MAYYADIVNVTVVTSSPAGYAVSVGVDVKNLYSGAIYATVSAIVDGVDIDFSPSYQSVNPGQTGHFTGSFIMPNHDVTITIWSWYWTGTEWYHDDTEVKTVTLSAAQPAVSEFAIQSYQKL